MGKKVLVILTSAGQMTNGKPTGWYLPELAHPYKVFMDNKVDIDVASPLGGKAPLDQSSVEAFKNDDICTNFLKDSKAMKLVDGTKKLSDVKASNYAAVFFPGGHGPMFDLANDKLSAQITADVYENGGVVAAVCHGPAGLVPVKLKNGDSIVKGKTVTSFTNEEEDVVQLSKDMPFMLETKLKELGGQFERADNWQCKVVVDGRLVTGQNPASSTELATKMIGLL